MKPLDLKPNGKYNFKNSDDRLIFIEVSLESSGYWYSFARVLDPEGVKIKIQGGRLINLEETVDEPAAEKCDGDHGGPKCADPECWNGASELTDLRNLYAAAMRLRDTAPVDDDFPEMMHNFDGALLSARKSINTYDMQSVSKLCQRQFDWVERMGWHNKTVLEALALIASEVGEAVNECRGDQPTENFKTELADICLRTFDLAQSHSIDLMGAILAKMDLNELNGTRGRRV
jgi:NTP pyrophosphatase (non-canonical NTP hydrolase)